MKLALPLLLGLSFLSSPCWSFSVSISGSRMRSLVKMSSTPVSAKSTLYDVPVSNNGARVRIILYKKKIPETEVVIVSPKELNGIKSPEYLALNPQGKMPLLVTPSLPIYESDTISRYLLSTYADDQTPSFLPDSPLSNLIARIHDIYIGPIQGCLYKALPPFGSFGTRSKALEEFRTQLRNVDNLIEETGLYLTGDEVSLADATLFPTTVFAKTMLPKFGFKDDDVLPPRVQKWYDDVVAKDEVFARVETEILGGLKTWETNGRWNTIHLAGLRDDQEPTIFDKIVTGAIPSTIVRETDDLLAFQDIAPSAPSHILVIPKKRDGLVRLRRASEEHVEILGKMLVMAGEIGGDESLGFGEGSRVVINDGEEGGQDVFHLHMHVLGGRKMLWPPG